MHHYETGNDEEQIDGRREIIQDKIAILFGDQKSFYLVHMASDDRDRRDSAEGLQFDDLCADLINLCHFSPSLSMVYIRRAMSIQLKMQCQSARRATERVRK